MEIIIKIWTFVKTHWDEFLQIIGASVAIATVVVRLTKNTKDDTFLDKLKKVLVYLSLLNEDGTSCKGK
jgi:hypothetical protein